MDLSKNKRFSTQEAKNDVPSTEKRKKVPVCKMLHLRSSELFSSSILPDLSKDNSIQRQVYDSCIIWVGAVFSICNDILTIYCHKDLHHRWCWGLRSASGQSISKNVEIKQNQNLHFQKEEPNKVWNLHSPNPNSPRRNQLSLLCNLEMGDKGSNGI